MDALALVEMHPTYPYFQKAEIEKQVQDMLKFGLTRISTSLFLSPVLLVKKRWVIAILY